MHNITSYLISLTLLLFVFSCSDSPTKWVTLADADENTENVIDGDIDDDLDISDMEQDIDADQDLEDIIYDRPCENNDQCEIGWVCDKTTFRCRECYCDTAADCPFGCYDCLDCACVQRTCLDSSDCCPQAVCMGGVCQNVISQCGTYLVISGATLISEGRTAQIEITAYNEHGYKLDMSYGSQQWSSNNSDIVSVDSNGILTGGTISGNAVITVEYAHFECTSVEASISIQNFKAVPETDSRVIVFDSDTNELLDNVDVYLNSTKVTTVAGIAEFPGIDCVNEIQGCELHVLPETHNYLSAIKVLTNDILIPVAPNVDISKAGGVKGHQDLDAMPEVLVQDIIIGLSLFSIPDNFADMDFKSVFGDMIQTNIKIGQSIDETIPLPSGMEGYLSNTPMKDGFQAQGIDGAGTLWGLGGYADIGELMALLTSLYADDYSAYSAYFATIMPLFENFYHGIMPGVEFDMLDKVLDIDDINGNGDKTDFVADYANFKDIDTTFGVTQKQSQSAEITFSDLPTTDAGCADSVFTVVGVIEDGVGFIPLGLNVAMNKTGEEDIDCKVGVNFDNKTTAVFAPQHSGVSGYDYYTMSIALSLEKLLSKTDDFVFSATLSKSKPSPRTITMPEFLPLISNSTSWNPDTHSIQADVTHGTSVNRLMLYKDYESEKLTKSWQIYWPENMQNPSFEHLPALTDNRGIDTNKRTYFQAMRFDSTTYNQLFELNANNLNNTTDFMDAFTNYYPVR